MTCTGLPTLRNAGAEGQRDRPSGNKQAKGPISVPDKCCDGNKTGRRGL